MPPEHISIWEVIKVTAAFLTPIIGGLVGWIGLRLKRLEERQDKLDDDFRAFREFYIERHSELKDLQLEIQKLRTDFIEQMGELRLLLAKEYMTKMDCKYIVHKEE
mgnify:CR=1 FL=1